MRGWDHETDNVREYRENIEEFYPDVIKLGNNKEERRL